LVTTPIGAQGLENLAGSLEICTDAKSFADAVLRFLDDDAAWLERSAQQVVYVNQTFSFAAQKRGLEEAFAEAVRNNDHITQYLSIATT
jgi:hypothetical protein